MESPDRPSTNSSEPAATSATSSSSSTSGAAESAAPVESWCVVVGKVRIDSFNQHRLTEKLTQARAEGHLRIALDLNPTRFLSLSAIQFLVQFAKNLAETGGSFALIAPSEKTKRHFEIYGSLTHIGIFRVGQSVPSAVRVELGAEDADTIGITSDRDH